MTRPLYVYLSLICCCAVMLRPAFAADPVPITVSTISASLPSEVVDGANAPLPVLVSELPIEFFDDFSWRSFVALMWPAKIGTRGAPDTTRPISDVSGPRVFEAWKSAYEVVPPHGVDPTPWASFDAITPCQGIPAAGSGHQRIIASFTKYGDLSQADFGTLAGPLVSQNRRFTHYEIKVNEPLYEMVRAKQLYKRQVLDALAAPVSFPNGSLEIKAAWREFMDAEGPEIRHRYYRTQAKVKNYITEEVKEIELGLVGFHIVQKTPLRPQWVWSSFEHVDNVPPIGQTPSPSSLFTFNNPTKPQVLAPSSSPAPITDSNYLTPMGEPTESPMQVVRLASIHPKTANMNARYQSALVNTVWANYMLVLTQWPTDTTDPDGVPFPDDSSGLSISNTSMETYFQLSTSCMSCHSFAREEKMDFVFFPLVHADRRDPGGAGTPTREFIQKLDREFKQSRQKTRELDRARLGLQ